MLVLWAWWVWFLPQLYLVPSSALSQWGLQRRRDHVQVTFPGLGQRRKTETMTETVTDTKTIKYVRQRQRH